jgi:hypothetical protein
LQLQQWQPKIDLCKWKSLDTPYPKPDDKPPFHFAPEAIGNEDTQKDNQTSTYDTYSCVILIWLLAIGEFIRPPFAQTNSVEDIQNIILSDTSMVKQELLQEIEERMTGQSEMELLSGLLRQNIVGESDRRMTINELFNFMKDV